MVFLRQNYFFLTSCIQKKNKKEKTQNLTIPEKAEADEVVPGIRAAVVAIRRTHADLAAVPAAAAPHTAGAFFRTQWIPGWTAAVIITAIPVPTPLIYVAAHVVDAELIGLFLACRVGFAV